MSDPIIHAVAGGVGGCISMSLTYPLIVLSTRSAVASKKSNLTPIQAALQILQTEGLAGLYAGLESSLLGIGITNTVFYAAFEESKRLILARGNGPAGKSSTSQILLASTIAGAATTIITNPIWLIQTHQATRGVNNKASSEGSSTNGKPRVRPSILQSAREIISERGIQGLWRGLGPALILVINPVLQYTAYDRLVQLYTAYRTKRAGGGGKIYKVSDWDVFLLGALAKAIATSGTYPYIVVKSRLQAATHQYKSSIKAVLQILREEGISGLYAGIGTKLLQSVLTASFLFVAQKRVFEMVKALMLLRAKKISKAVA